MRALIQDYVAGQELEAVDPTDPFESVERAFMDKLAHMVTTAQNMLSYGDAEVVLDDSFYLQRGEFLDLLQDPQISEWLRWMRLQNRAKFQTYAVGD